jgi:hypothetical protein
MLEYWRACWDLINCMQLNIHITEKDYRHFATMNMRKWRKYNRSFILIMLTAAWALFMFVYTLIHGEPVLTNASVIVLLLVLIYFMTKAVYSYRLTKEYASNPLLKNELSYILDDAGLSTKTKVSQSRISWELVTMIKQSKQILAIYISNSQAYLFPKEALNEEQKKELFLLLKKHLPAAKFNYTSL